MWKPTRLFSRFTILWRMTFSVFVAVLLVLVPLNFLNFCNRLDAFNSETKNYAKLLLRYFNEHISHFDRTDQTPGSFNEKVQNLYKLISDDDISSYGIELFLIDADGTILSHPNTEYLGKNISQIDARGNIAKAIEQMLDADGKTDATRDIAYEGDFFGASKSGVIYYDTVHAEHDVGGKHWTLGCFVPAQLMGGIVLIFAVIQIVFSMFGFAILFLAILLATRSITRPLRRLHAQTRQIAQGQLDMNLPMMEGNDEVAQLANAFGKMRDDLKNYIAERETAVKTQERIDSELRIAEQIQRSIVPNATLPTEWADRLDLDGCMKSARIVGGDFYDFFPLDEDRICLVIADVSGKSVPGAVLMARTNAFFRSYLQNGNTLSATIRSTNAELCRNNDSNMFVTLLGAVLHIPSGECELCSAGHNPPILLAADGTIRFLDITGGPLLGVDADASYESTNIQFSPGEAVYLYTDGVTEALNTRDEPFGNDRMCQVLQNSAGRSAKEIDTSMVDALCAFSDSAGQSDDITMITLRLK